MIREFARRLDLFKNSISPNSSNIDAATSEHAQLLAELCADVDRTFLAVERERLDAHDAREHSQRYDEQSAPKTDVQARVDAMHANEQRRLIPSDLLKGIIVLAQAQSNRIKNDTDTLDVSQETKRALRNYEEENNVKLNTLSEMLRRARIAHVDQFVQTEQASNSAAELELLAAHEAAEFGARLSDANKLELVKKLQVIEVQLAGELAALRTVQQIAQELARSRGEKKLVLESLKERFVRIQSLDASLKQRRALIERLFRENDEQRKRLINAKDRILAILSHEVSPLVERLGPALEQMRQFVSRDLVCFDSSELSQFLLSSLTDAKSARTKPVEELSINQLGLMLARQNSLVIELFETLGIAQYTSGEAFLNEIVAMKHSIEDNAEQLEFHQESVEQMLANKTAQQYNSEASLQRLEHEAQQVEEQVQQWLPSLRRSISEIERALEDAALTQRMAEHWWDQPAQNAVPWIRLDAMNMAEWRARWHALCVELSNRR